MQYRFNCGVQLPGSPIAFAKGDVVEEAKLPAHYLAGWKLSGIVEAVTAASTPTSPAPAGPPESPPATPPAETPAHPDPAHTEAPHSNGS